MAFTTTTRLKALIRDSGVAFHNASVEAALTNVAASANAELEKLGVPSTETDLGLLSAADRLAISLMMDGEIIRMLLRGESQAVGSYRLASLELRESALRQAQLYISVAREKTTIANNRNWAYERGGAFYRGSEAGQYRRITR